MKWGEKAIVEDEIVVLPTNNTPAQLLDE